MKDRLEEFVRGHRQEFDSFEPDDALWNKIEKNLERGKKVQQFLPFRLWCSNIFSLEEIKCRKYPS
jgi:hypothetical protein